MLPSPLTLLTAAAALAVVLGLILAAGRLAPRLGFSPVRSNGRRLRLEESLALDPRRRLHLVTCDGRHVLLLTGGGTDLVVGWTASPPPPERDDAP